MNVRRAVTPTRTPVNRLDLCRQRQIHSCPVAHRTFQPRIESTSRNLQQSAHHPDRMGGLVHLHESEERFEVPLSVANQAAALTGSLALPSACGSLVVTAITLHVRGSSDRRRLCRYRAAPAGPTAKWTMPLVQTLSTGTRGTAAVRQIDHLPLELRRIPDSLGGHLEHLQYLTMRCPRKRVNSKLLTADTHWHLHNPTVSVDLRSPRHPSGHECDASRN